MKFQKDTRIPNLNDGRPMSRLRKVISDLIEGSDIEGAVLVDGKEEIIACDLPKNTTYKDEIHEILELLEERDCPVPNEYNNVMFAQSILDYNGCKILAKKLKDKITLLVLLRKRGYISLAMLEIENSIRRIDEIILEQVDFNDTARVST